MGTSGHLEIPQPAFFVWMALILGFIAFQVLNVIKRDRAIAAMALRYKLAVCGSSLPNTLSLDGTIFENASRIRNVLTGVRSGIDIVVFDSTVGRGKGSWSRTIMAARSPRDVFGPGAFDPNLTTARVGEWLLLYEPKQFFKFTTGLWSVVQIEAQLNAIGEPRSGA